MRITAVIAEYNPFHNGHQYHLEEARRATDADAVIVLMSGDYVQRGEPALTGKYERTLAALSSGADAVFMLSLSASTGSAEEFAAGAVSILARMNVIDCLCFGSECPDTKLLSEAASVLEEEPAEYRAALKKYLSEGATFPKASAMAFEEILPGYSRVIEQPNNILGIQYMRALKRSGASISPVPVPRKDAGHSENALPDTGNIASASAIRNACSAGSDISRFVPETMLSGMQYMLFPDDLSSYLNYAILMSSADSLCQVRGMSEDMSRRILADRNASRSFSGWVSYLKTRNITRARASRALLSLVLGIAAYETPQAVRLLGFRRSASPVLRKIRDESSIPVITRLSDHDGLIPETEIRASRLYASAVKEKTGILIPDEYRRSPVIL